MTNEEMDRAIAEAVGWSAIEDRSAGLMMADGFSVFGYPPKGAVIGKKVPIPRYSTDLNAMHQVEKAFMSSGKANEYLLTLDNLVNSGIFCSEYNTVTASAFWRAQAFLRTIGKYSDATHPLP